MRGSLKNKLDTWRCGGRQCSVNTSILKTDSKSTTNSTRLQLVVEDVLYDSWEELLDEALAERLEGAQGGAELLHLVHDVIHSLPRQHKLLDGVHHRDAEVTVGGGRGH